ncbi:hypothetical protein cypCar_00045296, partial [Cyprinus carpio]
HEVLNTFRSNLLKKFEHLYEGTATQGNPTLLNEIYTELYITESENGEISNEHESSSLPPCESFWLSDCGVTDEGCAALVSALRSNPSHLRELNLSGNEIGDSGVTLLSAGLADPHCKLEKLWMHSWHHLYRPWVRAVLQPERPALVATELAKLSYAVPAVQVLGALEGIIRGPDQET